MLRRVCFTVSSAVVLGLVCLAAPASAQGPMPAPAPAAIPYPTNAYAQAQQQRAFGETWGGAYKLHDYERFYHYPYVYYPQNFYGNEYYQSSEDLYYRYPQEMRIPVYNRHWFNYYPEGRELGNPHKDITRFRRYHSGHHFILDVF